jgi:hypothetical protein
MLYSVLRIRFQIPIEFGKPDPYQDSHQNEEPDPDLHQSQKQDKDLHHSLNSGASKVQKRVRRAVEVKNGIKWPQIRTYHCVEQQDPDPDPHQTIKSYPNPEPRQCEISDPYPNQSERDLFCF